MAAPLRVPRLLLALGLLATTDLTDACSSSTAPPFVQSACGGSLSASVPDAAVDADLEAAAGEADGSSATVSCSIPANAECDLVSTLVAETITCAGTLGTTCPTAGLVGCCLTNVEGVSGEACFYGVSTVLDSTAAGCSSAGGVWRTTQ